MPFSMAAFSAFTVRVTESLNELMTTPIGTPGGGGRNPTTFSTLRPSKWSCLGGPLTFDIAHTVPVVTQLIIEHEKMVGRMEITFVPMKLRIALLHARMLLRRRGWRSSEEIG